MIRPRPFDQPSVTELSAAPLQAAAEALLTLALAHRDSPPRDCRLGRSSRQVWRSPTGRTGAQPSLWMTDDPVVDPGPLWATLLRRHPHTRLWPLLLLTLRPHGAALALLQTQGTRGELWIQRGGRRPWHSGEFEPVPAESVDAQDAAEICRGGTRSRVPTPKADTAIRHGSRSNAGRGSRRWCPQAPSRQPLSEHAAADEFAADLIAAPGAVAELTGRDSGVHVRAVQLAMGRRPWPSVVSSPGAAARRRTPQ